MSNSNGLPLAGESTSPVNVWADPGAGTVPYESTAISGARMSAVDDFELVSYCAGFDGHPGERWAATFIRLPATDLMYLLSLRNQRPPRSHPASSG
jgi:hypothetical protein